MEAIRCSRNTGVVAIVAAVAYAVSNFRPSNEALTQFWLIR